MVIAKRPVNAGANYRRRNPLATTTVSANAKMLAFVAANDIATKQCRRPNHPPPQKLRPADTLKRQRNHRQYRANLFLDFVTIATEVEHGEIYSPTCHADHDNPDCDEWKQSCSRCSKNCDIPTLPAWLEESLNCFPLKRDG